jgi:photosystem II stability/assembly factor-like uncharacterized protein
MKGGIVKYTLLFLMLISGAFALNYHGVALAPDNTHGWAVCIDTVLILHTTNGGATWQSQSNMPDSAKRFFDVTCIDQLTAWTCGILGEILHTDNGGLDWYGQAIGLSKYATRIEFIDQDKGWAACGDGTVGRTIDGGSYWDQIFLPWAWQSAELYGVSFVNEWDGWVVAGYADSMLLGQGLILKSSDGGINWDSVYQVSDFKDLFDVHFFNLLDGIVVGGDEADYSPIIMKTTDGGQNWSFITAPSSAYYLRAVDFVGSEGWAVGMNGTIIHTTDSGDTWAFQSNPASATLFDIDFSDNLHGLACGHYPNPFYKLTNIKLQISSSEFQNTLKIFDVSGRLIKDLSRLTHSALHSTLIAWDGTDHSGRQVIPGIYFIELTTREKTMTEKVIFLK